VASFLLRREPGASSRPSEGNLVAVIPVLEEGETDSAKIARLEREKEEEKRGREKEKRGREAAERGREKAEDQVEGLRRMNERPFGTKLCRRCKPAPLSRRRKCAASRA